MDVVDRGINLAPVCFL